MSTKVLYPVFGLLLGLGILFTTPTAKADLYTPASHYAQTVDTDWRFNLNLSPYPYGYYDYGYRPYSYYPYRYYRPYSYRYYEPVYPYRYYSYRDRDFDRHHRHYRDYDRHDRGHRSNRHHR